MIPIENYNVIYKGIIYNCLSLGHFERWDMVENKTVIDQIIVTVINSDDKLEVITGKADEFQFIRK
jgi:hypothetical protein